MAETVELRIKPELKIILSMDEFEIIDVSEPKNNGVYTYESIKSVKLNSEQTNWLISIFSVIVESLTGTGSGGKFKTKPNLNLELEDRNLKIWLNAANFEKAGKVTELISQRKTSIHQLQK